MQKSIIVDHTKCTGCMMCVQACSLEKTGAFNPAASRIRVIDREKTGVSTPVLCRHCLEPVCLPACPDSAITQDPGTGVVSIDPAVCISCETCRTVCPYAGPVYSAAEKQVVLCDLCAGAPACVDVCPTGALSFQEYAAAAHRAAALPSSAPAPRRMRMLTVDLTGREVTVRDIPRAWRRKYIGARGFAARLLYDLTGPDTDPLGSENVIIVAAGPLTGTIAPASSRCEVVSKSPLTGIYARGDTGGTFGAIMRYAGYDVIVFKGRSVSPVYLWIDDESVEIKDGDGIWGLDVWKAREEICSRHEATDPGNSRHLSPVGSLLIGPAGENLSMAACVMSGVAHAAALGGLGAVWGSKNLKGIAVRGSRGIDVSRPGEFLQACRAQWDSYHDDPMYDSTRKWGTLGWVGGSDSRSAISDYMLGTRFREIEEEAFEPLIEKNRACYGCPIHCDHFLHVKEGKYAGSKGEGVEGFVQILGMSFKTASAPFLAEWNNLCNRLGVNVSAAGVAIIWAIVLWKERIITGRDTDGIEITEGNEEAIMELTRRIAYREGFGDILADFPLKAAERLGRNSGRYAAHTKGQFAWMPGHGIGITLIYTMSLNVNTRGYDHLMGGMSILTPNLRAEFGITEDLLIRLGRERYGDADIFSKNEWDYHPKIVQAECDFEHMMVLADMMGTCKFATGYNHPVTGINVGRWKDFLRAATGESFSEDDLVDAAKRIIALERCYNAREGIRRIDDYPFYLWWKKKYREPHPLYTGDQVPLTEENYDRILDEWYAARGCDLQTGIPGTQELARCGLQDVAEDLRKRGIFGRNRETDRTGRQDGPGLTAY